MNYIQKTTKEYPVYETHIKARNKGFDEYEAVINTELPVYNKYAQMCVELEPELRVDGKHYKRYEVQDKTGETLIQGMEKLKLDMSKAVDGYIQNVVDTYNRENGTMFEKVHNCTAYKDITTYSHRQFCIDVLEFNANVWDTARSIEADVAAGLRPMPTVDELLAELPVFGV